MEIEVTFPDGSVRLVKSVKRVSPSPDINGAAEVVHEPAYDPDWMFVPSEAGWRAIKS